MTVSIVINSSPVFTHWWAQIKHDLRPFPGRWEQTWRIALLCALMTLVSMTFHIPAAVLSCYVIFFVMKTDSAESMVLAIALVVLVSIVVVILIGLVNLSISSPPARLAIMAFTSVILLYLGNASLLGPLGGIIALVIAFVMTLLAHVPFGEVATRAVLYAWLMTCAPMALVISFNLIAGRQPQAVLVNEVAGRLELAAQSLQQQASAQQVRAMVAEGIESQQKRLKWLKLFHFVPKKRQQDLAVAVIQSYQILLASLALTTQTTVPTKRQLQQQQQLATACLLAARQLRQSKSLPTSYFKGQAPDFSLTPYQDIAHALNTLSSEQNNAGFTIPEEEATFFVADALVNSAYLRTAIKATGAAILCYLIYSSIEWEGIHTAMITCYVATLGSSGETINKLVLRIIGALIGATLGVILLVFFMPHMTSIGTLMAAVFVVSILAAWVGIGSERVAYAGIQIAFAFFLITLQGFGPSVDLSVAGDRIVGILLGNLMMYLAFTQIWPYSVIHSVKKHMTHLQQILEDWATSENKDTLQRVVYAGQAAQVLEEAEYELSLAYLEPKRLHLGHTSLSDYQQQLDQLTQRFNSLVLGSSVPS